MNFLPTLVQVASDLATGALPIGAPMGVEANRHPGAIDARDVSRFLFCERRHDGRTK